MMRSEPAKYFVIVITVYLTVQMYTSGILKVPGTVSRSEQYHHSTSSAVQAVTEDRIAVRKVYVSEDVPVHSQTSSVKLLRGDFRSTQGFLTIGLCSVPRQGASYLIDTLESLFSRLTDLQKNEVVVVLYLGSMDATWVNNSLVGLDQRFEKEMNSSLLQVIQPEPHIYPNFSSVTKRNFGDDLDRVRWRTKQNVDFAYLFFHCKNISQYYIQIEDDVLVASDFLNDIKRFVNKQAKKKTSWFAIEFSSLGFIGKMFHSKHLAMISQYLLMFKEEQPCDLLINYMKRLMVQPKDIRSYVSLFQHIGKVSSLTNKTQKLTDTHYKDRKKTRIHLPDSIVPKQMRKSKMYSKPFSKPNPDAVITTSMAVYKDYFPQNAYLKYNTFFWGKDPHHGDYIEIKLKSLTNIIGIVINTGHPRLHTDKLKRGEVKLARDLDVDGDCDVRSDSYDSGEFAGQFKVTFPKPRPIICAVLIVKEDHTSWLIVNEIEIRTP